MGRSPQSYVIEPHTNKILCYNRSVYMVKVPHAEIRHCCAFTHCFAAMIYLLGATCGQAEPACPVETARARAAGGAVGTEGCAGKVGRT